MINKNEDVKRLVNQAVALDKEQRECKRKLDMVKAKLQSMGLEVIEERNVKYIKFYAEDGSVGVGDSSKMDVLRPDKLKTILSDDLWRAKVKESTETKYNYDPRLEQMLKAVFTGDFTFEYSLEEFLDEMSVKPDNKQKKLLLKKLKGDYAKDRHCSRCLVMKMMTLLRILMWSFTIFARLKMESLSGHFFRRSVCHRRSRTSRSV